jgi:adenylate cyclase
MKAQHELERRFLVSDRSVLEGHTGNVIVQAYLFAKDGYAVRVRRTHRPASLDGRHREEGPALLTAKGPRTNGSREEYEFQIPVQYGTELIKRAPHTLSKTRYQLIDNDQLWDVDVFHGDNEGIVIAECESQALAAIRIPRWCGREVTGEHRYDNENLASLPFLSWRGGADHEGRI